MPRTKPGNKGSDFARAGAKIRQKYDQAGASLGDKNLKNYKGSDRRDAMEARSRLERELRVMPKIADSDKGTVVRTVNKTKGTLEDVARAVNTAVSSKHATKSGSGGKPRDRRAAALKAAQTRKMRGNAGRK